jgi:penicillin-binding protein 1A
VGNDDNTATRGVTGGTLPAMIWKSAMRAAEKGLPLKPLDRSPPQAPNEEAQFPGGEIRPQMRDDEAGAAMAQIQAQGMPDMPSAPETRHRSGGLLGWLFGSDADDPPPPPPPRRGYQGGN